MHDDDLIEDETVQILKRRKIIEESKTNSETAQVVQNEEQQVTEETTNFDQVNLEKMTIADKKKLLWKKTTPVEPKSNLMMNQLATFGLRSKQPRYRTGLGSDEEKIQTGVEVTLRDPFMLTDKPYEQIKQKHLDKVMSAKIVIDAHDKDNLKEKFILFLNDGLTYRLADTDVLKKSVRELQHIHYLLEVKSDVTRRWSEYILKAIRDLFRISGIKTSQYIPMITKGDGREIPMLKNSAKVEVILKGKCLCYNENSSHPRVIRLGDGLERTSIQALRTAIYEIGDSKDEELMQIGPVMLVKLQGLYLDRINEGPHKPTKLSVVVADQPTKTIPKEKSEYTAKDISSIANDAKDPKKKLEDEAEPSATHNVSVFDYVGKKQNDKDLRMKLDKKKEKLEGKVDAEGSICIGSKGKKKEKRPSQVKAYKSKVALEAHVAEEDGGSSFTQSSGHNTNGGSSTERKDDE
ncbi:hypothetical protein AgCh_009862 [Apium graveolens]